MIQLVEHAIKPIIIIVLAVSLENFCNHLLVNVYQAVKVIRIQIQLTKSAVHAVLLVIHVQVDWQLNALVVLAIFIITINNAYNIVQVISLLIQQIISVKFVILIAKNVLVTVKQLAQHATKINFYIKQVVSTIVQLANGEI